MSTKLTKKALILELLANDATLTEDQLANKVKCTVDYARHIKEEFSPSKAKAEPQEPTGPVFKFADSPSPVTDEPEPAKKQSIVQEGLNKIRDMLGIKSSPTPDTVVPASLTKELNQRQALFVETFTPVASLSLVLIAGFLWLQIGAEYQELAPSEEIATRIVGPLLRVYARHVSFLTQISPDAADITASMLATVGYVFTSMKLYQTIKKDKEAYENAGYTNYAEFRRSEQATPEQNGTGNREYRYADVSRASEADVTATRSNGRAAVAVDRSTLSTKEQAQHAALLALSERDYINRARRSGRF